MFPSHDRGATLADLKQEFTTQQIGIARKTLQRRGYVIEKEFTLIMPRFEGLANADATREEIQELLNEIQNHRQISVLKEAGLIMTYTDLLTQFGIRLKDYKRMDQAFDDHGIPHTSVYNSAGEQSRRLNPHQSHIIASIHENRALELLKTSNPNSLRTPSKEILAHGKPVEDIPNDYQLDVETDYGKLTRLATRVMGRPVYPFELRVDKMPTPGSDITIYSSPNGKKYSLAQEEQVAAWLKSFLK